MAGPAGGGSAGGVSVGRGAAGETAGCSLRQRPAAATGASAATAGSAGAVVPASCSGSFAEKAAAMRGPPDRSAVTTFGSRSLHSAQPAAKIGEGDQNQGHQPRQPGRGRAGPVAAADADDTDGAAGQRMRRRRDRRKHRIGEARGGGFSLRRARSPDRAPPTSPSPFGRHHAADRGRRRPLDRLAGQRRLRWRRLDMSPARSAGAVAEDVAIAHRPAVGDLGEARGRPRVDRRDWPPAAVARRRK